MKIPNLIKAIALTQLAVGGTFGSVAAAQLPNFNWQTTQVPSRRIYQTAASRQSMEQAILTQINQYRASRRLPALTLDSRISSQAQAHSDAMASGRVPFSHDGFQQRVQVIARAIPYAGAAENVSKNMGYQDPATQAVQGWLKSSGHRKNIEGNYNLTGLGVAQSAKGEYFFTQIFIKKR